MSSKTSEQTAFSHFDEQGRAIMVDVSDKAVTQREATASGEIRISRETLQAIETGTSKKGDVLGVARVAGIMAAKRTSELIPLCHLLPLSSCRIEFASINAEFDPRIRAVCTVKNSGQTGVEMEALTGVSVALLTIYDMCKAIDKQMVIGDVHLVQKTGGRSGTFHFGEEADS